MMLYAILSRLLVNFPLSQVEARVSRPLSEITKGGLRTRYEGIEDRACYPEGDLREAALKLSTVDLATNLAKVGQSQPGSAHVSPQFFSRATLAQSVEQLIRNQ
jgi:hypothetical protein